MSDIQLSGASDPAAPTDSKLTPQEQYLLAIADELAQDPMGRGYANMKPDEIAKAVDQATALRAKMTTAK